MWLSPGVKENLGPGSKRHAKLHEVRCCCVLLSETNRVRSVSHMEGWDGISGWRFQRAQTDRCEEVKEWCLPHRLSPRELNLDLSMKHNEFRQSLLCFLTFILVWTFFWLLLWLLYWCGLKTFILAVKIRIWNDWECDWGLSVIVCMECTCVFKYKVTMKYKNYTDEFSNLELFGGSCAHFSESLVKTQRHNYLTEKKFGKTTW